LITSFDNDGTDRKACFNAAPTTRKWRLYSSPFILI
jgi:hypothetical protein